MMARVRTQDTRPEVALRKQLHKAGFRFRLHRRDLPGRPDIVLPRFHAAIFVHGCFWHGHAGCRLAYQPKTRREFWQTKFATNRARDELQAHLLSLSGWRVLTVWECGLRDPRSLDRTVARVIGWLLSKSRRGEIPASVNRVLSGKGSTR